VGLRKSLSLEGEEERRYLSLLEVSKSFFFAGGKGFFGERKEWAVHPFLLKASLGLLARGKKKNFLLSKKKPLPFREEPVSLANSFFSPEEKAPSLFQNKGEGKALLSKKRGIFFGRRRDCWRGELKQLSPEKKERLSKKDNHLSFGRGGPPPRRRSFSSPKEGSHPESDV